jgi:phage/plasmid-associated DNA primase
MAVIHAKEAWLKEANPLTAFVDERCSRSSDVECVMKRFYEEYREWAHDRGYTRTQQYQTVKRNLENLGFSTKKGNQGLIIVGLKLNPSRI